MDWLLFFYAILITPVLIGCIILVGWLIAKYEEETHIAILILACVAVIILAVSGVYLILKAGG